MKMSTLELGEQDMRESASDESGSYLFAVAIIVLSLLAGCGLSAAYLNDQSIETIVASAPS